MLHNTHYRSGQARVENCCQASAPVPELLAGQRERVHVGGGAGLAALRLHRQHLGDVHARQAAEADRQCHTECTTDARGDVHARQAAQEDRQRHPKCSTEARGDTAEVRRFH